MRPAPEELQKIADIALARKGESLDAFREAMMKRPYVPMTTPRKASAHSIDQVDPFQKAEIEWQDRLANQSEVIASDDTRSLGGWVQAFLAKEQQRVNAGELSASRFAAVRGTLFYFRDWAGAAMAKATVFSMSCWSFFEPGPVMGRDIACCRMLSRRRVRSMSANDGAVFDVHHGHTSGWQL
jgi:hypothetical protein